MLGLIIDTSREITLLGLIKDEENFFSKFLEGGKKLSRTFFPQLQMLLAEARCSIQDLSYIAVGTGPGSYMGVRTGVTIAKTLSFSKGLPLIEFPSPLGFLPEKLEGSFAYVGDAKMNELFLLTGTIENQEIQFFSSPILFQKEDLKAKTECFDCILREDLNQVEPHLRWVARYVHGQFLQGIYHESSELELSYLR